ncbi:hypothetical protein BJN34_31540 [Cupriavidus necator]|uniref:Endonuclease/exonuclease/phosphatase domain-containing protein n=1 Tax=Cupriavidus necator TaxID=106590 RepID=A0A1U9V0E3_CUPNE|nr:hypothetical protein [Cupriavidus necator]AQV98410.1 hypothetical protein BJN34_31540 [Cupriavidus necator]
MKPLRHRLFGLLLFIACLPVSAYAQSLSRGDGDLRVMTYNVDEGTDYQEVARASGFQEFLVAVGQTITQVRASNPPERMQALAKQIIAAGPALVSLQELDRWSSGPFDQATSTCGTVTPEFDMLQELRKALSAQGAHYEVAAHAQQYAFPPTPGLILPATFLCVQVVNQVVILARTDLDPSRFQWSNPQSAQFSNSVFLPTPIGVVPLPRAWVSVDAKFNNKAFRFIGTHLESAVAQIRELQGAELRAGPANTALPVILAMDSNAQAAPPPQDVTYVDFIAAGYRDAWSVTFPFLDGFTCCQAQFVNNPQSQLSQRIDLILTLGNIEVQRIVLFGATQASKTASGLWPSDHAGVAAQLAPE